MSHKEGQFLIKQISFTSYVRWHVLIPDFGAKIQKVCRFLILYLQFLLENRRILQMIQYFSLWFSRENSNSHNVSAPKPIQIEPYLSSFWLTMKLVVAWATSMSSWFFWIEDIAISFLKLAIFKRRFLDVEKLRTSCRYVRIVTDSQLHTTQAGESKFDYDLSNYNANKLLKLEIIFDCSQKPQFSLAVDDTELYFTAIPTISVPQTSFLLLFEEYLEFF